MAYLIRLNSNGGSPPGPAERLLLSLFIAAMTSCSQNSTEPNLGTVKFGNWGQQLLLCNSDKIYGSYCDFYFGVTFLEYTVHTYELLRGRQTISLSINQT